MKLNKVLMAGMLVATGAIMTGCNDLEQPPRNQFTDDNFWNAERADWMVMTAYSQMYGAGTMWSDERLADNLYSGYRAEDIHTIRRGIATSNTGHFGWGGWYGGIKSCHTFLANIGNVEGVDPAYVKRLGAESRFIRDFIFFRLAQCYGDVPFFMEDITLEHASSIKRTPYAEVIATITEDLEDLIKDLPKNTELPDAERGRITQGAAAMFRARIALMDSDWANVAKWCQAIVDGEYGSYDLYPTYEGVFSEDNEYNCEVILDYGYAQNLRTWGDISNMKPPSLRSTFVTWTPTQSLVDTYLTKSGYTIDESGTDYNPNDPYINRDPRMDATVIHDKSELYDPSNGTNHTIYIDPRSGRSDDNIGIGLGLYKTVTGYYVRKYFSPQPDDTGYSSGLNIIMMRYADVLLMLAEARYELGQMNSTVWENTIGAIRKRAGFTAGKALNMPTGDLRQIIRDERRVELALEGLRWWDIKRWKAGTEYLDGTVKGCTFVGGAAVLDTYSFNESRDYLWAVPQSEIDLNQNLKPQNPGYGS